MRPINFKRNNYKFDKEFDSIVNGLINLNNELTLIKDKAEQFFGSGNESQSIKRITKDLFEVWDELVYRKGSTLKK